MQYVSKRTSKRRTWTTLSLLRTWGSTVLPSIGMIPWICTTSIVELHILEELDGVI